MSAGDRQRAPHESLVDEHRGGESSPERPDAPIDSPEARERARRQREDRAYERANEMLREQAEEQRALAFNRFRALAFNRFLAARGVSISEFEAGRRRAFLDLLGCPADAAAQETPPKKEPPAGR